MTDREIECSKTITTNNSISCLGYSKALITDKSLNTNITEVIEPYKKLKRMYKVDRSGR